MSQKTKSFEDGDVIFREGDPGGSGYAIVKGKVALSKDTSRGQVEIEVLGKSANFGEVGVMNGGLRTLSATAVGQVTVELVEQGATGKASSSAPDVLSPASAAPLPRVQGWISRLLNMVSNKSKFIEVRIVPFHGPGGELLPGVSGTPSASAKASGSSWSVRPGPLLKRPLPRPISGPASAKAGKFYGHRTVIC